jgi:hypothetical protein
MRNEKIVEEAQIYETDNYKVVLKKDLTEIKAGDSVGYGNDVDRKRNENRDSNGFVDLSTSVY